MSLFRSWMWAGCALLASVPAACTCTDEVGTMGRDAGEDAAIACESDCEEEGLPRCSGDVLETCTLVGDEAPCLRWVPSSDCAALGMECRGDSCCLQSCTRGATRCSGDVFRTCVAGENGCTRWLDEDCAATGRVCATANGAVSCMGCGDADICDPDCGIVGVPCENDRQCQAEFGDDSFSLTCREEANPGDAYPEFGGPGGYCAALPDASESTPCDPADDSTCPSNLGGVCLTNDDWGYSLCLRSCELTDETWAASNCGCRAGYECDLGYGVCAPGCRTDAEGEREDCCHRWEDGSARVDIPDCTARCDPATFRCVAPGTPGALIGDPCLSYQDCPQNGRCLIESRDLWSPVIWAGGYCVRDGCELEGRECLGDSNCASPPYYWPPDTAPRSGRLFDSWPGFPIGSGWAHRYDPDFPAFEPIVGPHRTCLAACTVTDNRIVDPFADPNPACREGYGCVGDPELSDHAVCASDDECEPGRHCIGGVCNGNGSCLSVSAPLSPHIRFCDTGAYPDTGCPGDDPDTARWDEAQRCEDGVCQAPCDGGHACAGNTQCVDGYCAWSNAGGPCLNGNETGSDSACVSPYGQGFCAWSPLFGEDGTCVIAECDAPAMAEYCTDGRTCEHVFGGHYCLAQCELPPEGCAVAEECQGEAVGCRDGFSCHAVREGAATGVCLASCSAADDPDAWCERVVGDGFGSCDLVTGICVQ